MSHRTIGRNPSRTAVVVLAVCALGAPFTNAQQTTEQYIPIGQSPGVSGTQSYIGRVIAVDSGRQTISVDDRRGVHLIKVVETTSIWFDRSKANLQNRVASYDDCKVGARVEVMYEAGDETTASWIKIEAP